MFTNVSSLGATKPARKKKVLFMFKTTCSLCGRCKFLSGRMGERGKKWHLLPKVEDLRGLRMS